MSLSVFRTPLLAFLFSLIFLASPLWVGYGLERLEWIEKKTEFSLGNSTGMQYFLEVIAKVADPN